MAPESTTAVATEAAALAPCETPDTIGTTTPVWTAGTSELMTVLASVETAPTTFETTSPASPATLVTAGTATDTTVETRSPVLSTIEVAADPTSETIEGMALVATEIEAEITMEGRSPRDPSTMLLAAAGIPVA